MPATKVAAMSAQSGACPVSSMTPMATWTVAATHSEACSTRSRG